MIFFRCFRSDFMKMFVGFGVWRFKKKKKFISEERKENAYILKKKKYVRERKRK